MNRALAILRVRRELLEPTAQRLLEKETHDEKDLSDLLGISTKFAARTAVFCPSRTVAVRISADTAA